MFFLVDLRLECTSEAQIMSGRITQKTSDSRDHDEQKHRTDDIGSYGKDKADGPQSGGMSEPGFRDQIRAAIASARSRGLPSDGTPESFEVACKMDIKQIWDVQALIGECNDAPFCGADTGCLTLARRVRSSFDVSGRFAMIVHFDYAGAPRSTIKASHPGGKGEPQPMAQHGADFAGHLP
jgi:hypothetical protein